MWEGLEFWNNSYDFWSFGCLRDNVHCWCPFLMCFPSSSFHGEAEMTKKFKQRWRESRNLGTGPSGLVQASLICSLKQRRGSAAYPEPHFSTFEGYLRDLWSPVRLSQKSHLCTDRRGIKSGPASPFKLQEIPARPFPWDRDYLIAFAGNV